MYNSIFLWQSVDTFQIYVCIQVIVVIMASIAMECFINRYIKVFSDSIKTIQTCIWHPYKYVSIRVYWKLICEHMYKILSIFVYIGNTRLYHGTKFNVNTFLFSKPIAAGRLQKKFYVFLFPDWSCLKKKVS
jgi:hypothetical protein